MTQMEVDKPVEAVRDGGSAYQSRAEDEAAVTFRARADWILCTMRFGQEFMVECPIKGANLYGGTGNPTR